VPVLPQIVLYAEENGQTFGLQTGLAFGLLSALYQFCSIPSLMVTTRLSDTYGRRPFFIAGFFGSAVGFIVIALYTQISPALVAPMIGRGLGGVFSASPPLAQAYITDIAGARSSSSAIYRSYMSSIFMFALVFAPGFGGGLAELGLSVPFFVSAGLAVCGGLVSVLYLQESMLGAKPVCGGKEEERPPVSSLDGAPNNNNERKGKSPQNEEKEVPKALKRIQARTISVLFVCGALFNLGFRIFIMMAPLWLNKKFGWGAAMYGFVTSGVGCLGIFVNIKIYPRLLKTLGKHGCCVVGPLINTCGFLVVYASQTTEAKDDPRAASTILKGPLLYVLGMGVIVLGNSTTGSSLTSLVARYANASGQGSIQGRYQATQAMTGFCAPLIGGLLLDTSAWEAVPALSAALFFSFACLSRYVIKLNHDMHKLDPIEGEKYESHSWCELIPGVKNPTTAPHYDMHKLLLLGQSRHG